MSSKIQMNNTPPNTKQFDIVGIGHAVVDIISYKNEEFIKQNNLNLGLMTPLSKEEINKLYSKMNASTECSGGCTANTIAAYTMLGGSTAFIGKINKDYYGRTFQKSLTKIGVTIKDPEHRASQETGRCLIMITEEKQPCGTKLERTMATYLGASNELDENDINEDIIKSSKYIFLEGYLWDSKTARNAFTKAINIAKMEGVKIIMSLSDKLCVERNREDFIKIIENDVDILLGNEKEMNVFFGEKRERQMIYNASQLCKEKQPSIIAITKGRRGSFIITKDEVHNINARLIENTYDVTGAGDLYAAGLLYGIIQGATFPQCGNLASNCAAEITKYLGARPPKDISHLTDILNDK